MATFSALLFLFPVDPTELLLLIYLPWLLALWRFQPQQAPQLTRAPLKADLHTTPTGPEIQSPAQLCSRKSAVVSPFFLILSPTPSSFNFLPQLTLVSHPLTPSGTPCRRNSWAGQKNRHHNFWNYREKTETKEQNSHPTNQHLDYNFSNPRCKS